MAKKKSWFERLKSLFISDSKPKHEKTESRKRWLSRRLSTRAAPALPAPTPVGTMSLREAEKEQSKRALAVAVVTVAAAEAAVAAAQAAAQVVRLTGNISCYQDDGISATKIQAAFRGYLARKALRALRGLVKLQSLVRGQLVRRQATATMKGLQSMMKIQSHACASRFRSSMDHLASEYKDIIHVSPNELAHTKSIYVPPAFSKQTQQNGERDWNSSTLSKEDMSAIRESRREAAFKRLRALEYASTHQERKNSRRPATPTAKRPLQADDFNQRWSWLEQWVDAQPLDNGIPERIPPPSPDDNPHDLHFSDKIISVDFQDIEKEKEVQLRYLARRSFMRPQRASVKDDNSFSSSPSLPGYMASTASTKAKFRSISTPKQRLEEIDMYYDQCTPNRNRAASPLPSIASEMSLSKTMKPLSSHQRSPQLKGHTPVRSRRSSNHLSFDSELQSLNWDQHHGFR